MNTQYYTVPEVALVLNLSTRTVRRMIASGDLPANKVGGSVRIAPGDLSCFLNATKIEKPQKRRRWKGINVSARKLEAQAYFREKYGEKPRQNPSKGKAGGDI